MTDTDGLLRDAGGARPTSDVDALIERLQGATSKARIMDVFARDANGNPMKDHGTSWPIVIVGKDLIEEAAAALVQLRDALRDMTADRDSWEQQNDDRVSDVLEQAARAERAEAEVARLKEQASAVVVIMPPREPTQEMDDAASNVDRSNLPGIFRRQVWRAMWDASGVAKASVITGNKP